MTNVILTHRLARRRASAAAAHEQNTALKAMFVSLDEQEVR